jgi:aquaporin Z
MPRTRYLNWPEYLCEALGVGLFVMSVGACATLISGPTSPIREAVPGEFARRVLVGLTMGLTAIILIYAPWGRASGAHLNPATTLTFWRLGRVSGRDAVFYTLAQFVGAAVGNVYVCAIFSCDFL